MKKIGLTAVAATFCLVFASTLAAPSYAASFGRLPASYEQTAESYVKRRLSNRRGASVQLSGKPYRVYIDVNGKKGIAAWAVPVSVRSKVNGRNTRSRVTVFMVNGRPVATAGDRRVRYRRS
ncbi:MAG: hypothetical protein AAGH38_02625 [Pseudomonadota bacterium]